MPGQHGGRLKASRLELCSVKRYEGKLLPAMVDFRPSPDCVMKIVLWTSGSARSNYESFPAAV